MRTLAIIGVAWSVTAVGTAAAQSATTSAVTATVHAAVTPAEMETVEADQRREVPDYDGRGDAPTSAREILLWIPRILLSPLYVLTEYGMRRPIAWLASRNATDGQPERLGSLFRFGDRDQLMLIPTAAVDLGFRAHGGLYFRWDQAGSRRNKLRYYFATSGPRWFTTTIADRYEGDEFLFEARLGFIRRADGAFWEIGGQGSDAIRSHYSWDEVDGRVQFTADLWRRTFASITTGVRWLRLENRPFRGPSVFDRVDEGVLPALPTGFRCNRNGEDCEGYVLHRTRVEFRLDTRRERSTASSEGHLDHDSGIAVEGYGAVSYDIHGGPQSLTFVNYGGSLSGHLDVTGSGHVASLGLAMNFAEALRGEIPFTELPRLSGDGVMRGFIGNFLVGQSDIAATLSYRWPLWVLLDGTMHFSVGNSFGPRLAGFDWDRMRMSFDVGIEALDQTDHFLEVRVGFGTSTFDQGAAIDSFRLFVGGKHAF